MKNNLTNNKIYGFIEKCLRLVPHIYLIARYFVKFTNYFEEDFFALKKIFKLKKINILDIGASDGISTKFFINNLNCNKIICYEPQLVFCKRIAKLNKKYNLEIHNYGLGSKDKKIINYYPEISFFGLKFLLLTYCFSSIQDLKKQIAKDFLYKTKIQTCTLIIKKFKIPVEKISLVKIDTNGSEYEIVKSLKDLIKRDKPIFIIENNNIKKINLFLKKYKYKKYVFNNNNLEYYSNQKKLNIIFK